MIWKRDSNKFILLTFIYRKFISTAYVSIIDYVSIGNPINQFTNNNDDEKVREGRKKKFHFENQYKIAHRHRRNFSAIGLCLEGLMPELAASGDNTRVASCLR